MQLRKLVWTEIFQRKNQLVTSLFAILLGITVVVAIKNITFYSEKAVAKELDALGANILVLPKSASVQDYYSADMQEAELPEEYVTTLAASDLKGLDNLSPKLSVPLELEGRKFVLTGILPKSEFQAKTSWQGTGIFGSPVEGCGALVDVPDAFKPPVTETLVRKRVIEDLEPDEALVGADVAAILGVGEGDTLPVLGKDLRISAVLPQTGTVDDSRVFAHLHTVQKLTRKPSVLNAIEIVGCCQEISQGLVGKLNTLLPGARVVTVSQVVDTQVGTNRMMSRLSMIFLVIIVLVGGASIANYMYANVFERRREIGTLMAMGATSSLIMRMFLLKGLLLGLAGGLGGYLLGTALAVGLGPRIAGIPVLPIPQLALWALGISLGLALLATLPPAWNAARLDPCATLQEV